MEIIHNGPLLVTASSVGPGSGKGLYALETFAANERLPCVYPGIEMSDDQHEQLNEFLSQVTHRSLSVQQTQQVRQVLRDKYDICIVGDWNALCDWDTLYDSFVAYRFQARNNHVVFCWNAFKINGRIHAATHVLEHALLFVNEPPATRWFHNRLSEKRQSSEPNVWATFEDGHICFRATRTVCALDEVLIHYGPWYNRNYETNSSSASFD